MVKYDISIKVQLDQWFYLVILKINISMLLQKKVLLRRNVEIVICCVKSALETDLKKN
jgi:hypothetical protein